jgi:alpha-L-fucosidase
MDARPRRSARFPAVLGVLLLLAFVSGGNVIGGDQPPGPATTTGAASAPDPRLDWWREARFGLFIHWGLYAVPAGEWNGRTDYGEWIRHTGKIPLDVYDQLRARFNPTKFDPDGWVRLAKQAGMKYIVITTKHHDGFALFDSKQTDFDVMSTPFRRDVMKALADAAAKEGIRICWYHSIMDWHHPDYLPRRDWEAASRPEAGADFERYLRYMKAQLRELLTNYGPIGVLWFDGQWEGTWTNRRGRELYDYVRSLQPSIIINNRVGRAGGDFGLNRDEGLVGDFGTPEQEIPATGVPGLDWETCMTMNRNWGYNRADKDFKSTKDLVQNLVDIVSKGGNFLLNVGPTADGEFPPESVERLQQIGAWMKVNAEAIQGTGASPFPTLTWGRATQRRLAGGNTRLYLHVFDWPKDGVLEVPGILNDATRAFLFADPSEAGLAVSRREDALRITLPGTASPDATDTVVVLDLTGRPDVTVPPSITAETPIFVDQLEVGVNSSRERIDLRYTTDGTEPSAQSPIVTKPLQLTKTTIVKARAFRGVRAVSGTSEATFRRVPARPAEVTSAVVPGLQYEVVEGDFKVLPDFAPGTIVKSGAIADIDLAPRTRQLQWAIRFRGLIRVPATGVYRFRVRSDDGSRLWIGDALVVDNDGLHSAHEESGVVALAAGLHPITVAMFEQSGGFELEVGWSGPGMANGPIPRAAFFRPVPGRVKGEDS